MSTKKVEVSEEVKSLVEVFRQHKGEKMTFANACKLANVPCKTGYLSGVKKIFHADLNGVLMIGEKDMEVEVIVKKKVNSYTYTPTEND